MPQIYIKVLLYLLTLDFQTTCGITDIVRRANRIIRRIFFAYNLHSILTPSAENSLGGMFQLKKLEVENFSTQGCILALRFPSIIIINQYSVT